MQESAHQPMSFEIREERPPNLSAHGTIPCAFRVAQIVDLAALDRLSDALPALDYPAPFTKDYDAIPGNRPVDWSERLNAVDWTLFAAWREGERIGGALVAVDAPGVRLLDGDPQVAMLWDLRVHPASRGSGVGAALFQAAETWGATRGCRSLKAETQHINLAACRLYQREGCRLEQVQRGAYLHFPTEVLLVWSKTIPPVSD